MDWDGTDSSFKNFVSLTDHSSIGFLYDYFNNNFSHFPCNSVGGILMGDNNHNHPHPHHDAHVGILTNYGNGHLHHLHGNNDHKKKKLRRDQLDCLERTFQEEIKLDPDRKLRLSRELGLQPRQIAVWFQNRRVRWQAKQLERLYDVLKMEFDTVSQEKLKLQEEVLRLKAMVCDAMPTEKQDSAAGQTEVSGEEIAESTRHSNEVILTTGYLMKNANGTKHNNHHDRLSNDHEIYDAAAVMNSYWGGGGIPTYP